MSKQFVLALRAAKSNICWFVQSDGGLGGTVSIESRLTQLITINMGGFVSTPTHYGDVESRDEQDWVLLNHGLWAAPGWRIPHRYGNGKSIGIL